MDPVYHNGLSNFKHLAQRFERPHGESLGRQARRERRDLDMQLLADGHSPRAIATLFGLHRSTVLLWAKQLREK
jgi:DNA invertase Pin-like site-specific DNA recombinase